MLLNEFDAKKMASDVKILRHKCESYSTSTMSRDQKDWPKSLKKIKTVSHILGNAENIGFV